MDTFPNQQSGEPQGVVLRQGNGKKGIFEILLIVVLIVITLVLLNYLNIIPLSNTFPQLGFLPHRPQQSPTTNSQPTPIPTSNNSVSFQYDTEKAKAILNQYIKDTIKPEFIPEPLDIKQGLTGNNRVEENLKHLFGVHLINKNETITVTFHYKENTNIPNDIMLFIQSPSIEKKTLSPQLATTLTSSYFAKSFPISSCNTKGTTSYCETFRTEPDGKRGYGAILAEDPSKNPSQVSIVFNCFIPKESKDYNGMKSCITP